MDRWILDSIQFTNLNKAKVDLITKVKVREHQTLGCNLTHLCYLCMANPCKDRHRTSIPMYSNIPAHKVTFQTQRVLYKRLMQADCKYRLGLELVVHLLQQIRSDGILGTGQLAKDCGRLQPYNLNMQKDLLSWGSRVLPLPAVR